MEVIYVDNLWRILLSPLLHFLSIHLALVAYPRIHRQYKVPLSLRKTTSDALITKIEQTEIVSFD